MNNASYVKANLNRFAAEGLFTPRNVKTLQSFEECLVSTLDKAASDGKLPADDADKLKYFQNVCNYVLETSSFLFKKALEDYGVEDAGVSKFYREVWLIKTSVKCISGSSFDVLMKDLYITCNSSQYFDLHLSWDAYAVLNGLCPQSVYDAVFRIADEMGFVVTEDASPDTRVGILSAIPSATALVSTLQQRIVDSVLQAVEQRGLPKLKQLVWEGTVVVPFSVSADEVACEEAVNAALAKKGLRLDVVAGQLECLQGSSSFDGGSESAVAEFVQRESTTGYDLYAVSSYCKGDLFNSMLEKAVNDLLGVLQEIRIKDTCVTVPKLDTHLPVYEVLFKDLADKGFRVSDTAQSYKVVW